MFIKLIFIAVAANRFLTYGDLAPDLHWTFDVSENQKTYEVNSPADNVGRMLNGTKIIISNERFGSVAYFSGENSQIKVDNLTSSCFLSPSLCGQGLSFSFWINRVQDGRDSFIQSPNFALKNMDANTLVTEIWNGSKSWHTFVLSSPLKNGIWTNLLFIWDKSALKISKNGIEINRVNFTETTDSRFAPLFPINPLLPTQLIFGGETKMYLDDIKIWNRPLSDEEANQVYEEGKYDQALFEVEDITDEPQFFHLSTGQPKVLLTTFLGQQEVESLIECFKVCSKIQACKVAGFKEETSRNLCQIRHGLNTNKVYEKDNDGFHFYSAERG